MRRRKGPRRPNGYESLKKAYMDLKESHLELIFRLALMAEYRDPDMGVHLARIADYSSIIAKGLQLSDKDVEIIRYASPMHDIGKIMLPDKILKKKSKLTEEEKTIMRKHAEIGADIFKNAKSPIMQACGAIALVHHERFDGSGYPNGLKGKNIPLYGRIVALADCFDAYTSKRPYKKAYSFEKAVSMIMERVGTHFDPTVVMSFMRNKDKIKGIWQSNRDIMEFLKEAKKAAEDQEKEKAPAGQ